MEEIKVVKNASWILGARIVKTLLGVLISMLTARYLGPSNFGLVNYAASLVTFISPIMYLGLNSTLVQEIVKHPNDEGKVLGTSILMTMTSSFFCILGIVSFSAIANKGEKATLWVCFLYSLILIFQSIDMIRYWFQAKLMSKYSSIVSLIAYIVVSGYRVFLLASGKSVYWFAVASALDIMIIAFSLIVIYKRKGGQKLCVSLTLAKEMLNKSKYYIISGLMLVVFENTDRIMLKLLANEAEVGYYSAAFTCATMSGLIFGAILDSMRPELYKSKEKSINAFEKGMILLYSVVIYSTIAYSVAMVIFAPLAINILYGAQYASAIPVLRIVVWYGTSAYLSGARDIWILAENKQKHLLLINAFGVLVNIVLNWLLIPKFAANGAAIATVISQIAINIIFVSIYPPTKRNGYLMLCALNPKGIIDFIKLIIGKKGEVNNESI